MYLVGSKILQLENAKDTDYIVLEETTQKIKKVDFFQTTIEKKKRELEFKEISKLNMYNYQYDQNIRGDDFPIKYNLLDYRSELIEYLAFAMKRKMFNFNNGIICNSHYCPPQYYHIVYNIFILQNNSPTITPEQKKIIQQIHDVKMPIEYTQEIINMFEKLKKEG